MPITSSQQPKVVVLVVSPHLLTRAHDLLYGGMCSVIRVCADVSEGMFMVLRNKTFRTNIRSIDE
jgi:hypothetical protein